LLTDAHVGLSSSLTVLRWTEKLELQVVSQKRHASSVWRGRPRRDLVRVEDVRAWSVHPGSGPVLKFVKIHSLEHDASYLALEDGRVFRGKATAPKANVTARSFLILPSRYQEIFTDPSYCGQIVVLTNPENRKLRHQS